MQKVIKAFSNACFFLVCYAQIPIIAGNMLLNDGLPALLIMAAMLPLCFLLALIPGRVELGRKAQQELPRASRSNDPDPDRSLRREELPMEQAALPLRAIACALTSAALAAGICMLPFEPIASAGWFSRTALACILAGMLPLALKMAALSDDMTPSAAMGAGLYAAAGAISFFVGKPELERWLGICGMIYFVSAAFMLNNRSMKAGTRSDEGVRPPAAMRKKNRMILLGLALPGTLAAYFSQVRHAVIRAGTWVWGMFGKAVQWVITLGGRRTAQEAEQSAEMLEETLEEILEEAEAAAEEAMAQGGMSMQELFGGETAPFWAETEQMMIIICIIVVLIGLFFWGRTIIRLLIRAAKKIRAWLAQLGRTVSEEYEDEHESLLDWDEARRQLGDNVKKRISTLFVRQPRWEEMSVRERVRHVVRVVYRRTKDAQTMTSLTIREAAPYLQTGKAKPERLAELYEQARYGQGEIDEKDAERLRKEAKV